MGWNNRVWDPKAADTTSGVRLSVYRVLKLFRGTEHYVAANTQFVAQRAIAGLQMGCLPLAVETGRYTQPHIRGVHTSYARWVRRTKTLTPFLLSPATRTNPAI